MITLLYSGKMNPSILSCRGQVIPHLLKIASPGCFAQHSSMNEHDREKTFQPRRSLTAQYCIRRSDRRTRVCVVQEMEMAEGASRESFSMDSSRDGKIAHVLEGPEGMEATLAANTGLVARLKAIIDGQAYQLGDFIIRVGSCRKGAVYKGLCLEVEYKPCCIVLGGVAMIEALLPTIDDFGTFVRSSDLRDPAVFGTNPEFSVQHTALQTINLLSTVLI